MSKSNELLGKHRLRPRRVASRRRRKTPYLNCRGVCGTDVGVGAEKKIPITYRKQTDVTF